MLPKTVRQGSRLAFWKTMPTWRWGPWTERPASHTCPRVGGSKPASTRSRVLLPQPEGPRMATNAPSSTANDRSSSTGRSGARPSPA